MADCLVVRSRSTKKKCGYELPSEIAHDFSEIQPCERQPVADEELCWLHLKRKNKPEQEILDALRDEHVDAGAFLPDFDFPKNTDIFTGRIMPGSNFQQSNLRKADFSNSVVAYSDFSEAVLVGADFQGTKTDITRCRFDKADCTRAQFVDSTGRESTFVGSTIESAKFYNAKFERADFTRAQGRESDYINSHLATATFSNADLRRAYFQESHLNDSTFSEANIHSAIFVNAQIYQVDFRGAIVNSETFFGTVCRYEASADNEAENIDCSPLPSFRKRSELSGILRVIRSLRRGATRLHRGEELSRTRQLNRAVNVYRTYQRLFRENSLPKKVQNYEIRERDARRKFHLADGRYMNWMWLAASQKLFNYSFSPIRILFWSVSAIMTFSFLFLYTGFEYRGSSYQLCACGTVAEWVNVSLISATASIQTFLPGASTGTYFAQLHPWIINAEAMAGTLALSLFVFTLGQKVRQ